MGDVWIPDNPSVREYTCPGCNKRVAAKRIGESCSYVVEHPDEKIKKGDEGEGKCKYKGPIDPKLLGYRPPKPKPQPAPPPVMDALQAAIQDEYEEEPE